MVRLPIAAAIYMWYWLFRIIFIIIFKLCFGLKAEGLGNLPKKTNFIIVANHTSFLDATLVMAAVPRQIHCIALRGLYRIFWLRWFLRAVEALPSGSSSKGAIELLHKNKNVGLFPEGGRSHHGKLREFKRGVALLAMRTGRPIVPCAIIGAYEAFPRKAKFPKFPLPIKVKIGKPIYLLKEACDLVDDLCLQSGTFKIRNAIKEMIYG